jgi:hypothetical protein
MAGRKPLQGIAVGQRADRPEFKKVVTARKYFNT